MGMCVGYNHGLRVQGKKLSDINMEKDTRHLEKEIVHERGRKMIDVNNLRKGITFNLDGNLYKVLEYSHHKPGRGNATIRIKAQDLRSGAIIERTFQSGDRVQDIRLDYHNVQYLYNDGELFHFMDLETYEQPAISKEVIGDLSNFLKENMEAKLTFYEGEPLDVELPTSVDLKVTQADVAVRGDTATGVTKKVTTETGLLVQVPNFVQEGDTIRVDTRTGSYVTRVS
jgi:elongation factor P